jgi:hypothetical protein
MPVTRASAAAAAAAVGDEVEGDVDEEDDDDDDDDEYRMAEYGPTLESSASRGLTRSGQDFRRTNRPFYSSMAELRRAHARIFSPRAVLHLVGKFLALSSPHVHA